MSVEVSLCKHDWWYGPIDPSDGVRKSRLCQLCSRRELLAWVVPPHPASPSWLTHA